MKSIEISLSVKIDGNPVDGSPFIRRVNVDETQSFETEQASGGGYLALPTSLLDTLQFLLLSPDQQVTLRLNDQSDAGIVLNANSLLLILDAAINSGATTNAKVDNSSGSTTVLKGVAAGT